MSNIMKSRKVSIIGIFILLLIVFRAGGEIAYAENIAPDLLVAPS